MTGQAWKQSGDYFRISSSQPEKTGAELYTKNKMQLIPTEPAREVDPTGAGDIFAAAFIIAKSIMGKSHPDSAHFANALAGISITRPGIDGIPTVE